MTKADQFSFPCQFTGQYPNDWAGYTFLQPTSQNALHPGIDWNRGAGEDDFGDPVQAIADGVCVHTSEQSGIGYGEICVIRHELTDRLYEFIKSKYGIDSRILYSFYAHLKDVNVKVNQEVERGDLIAWIGRSGTTVSHLHQELYKPVPGTTWRYWPTLAAGWDAERLKKYYLDTFDVVTSQPQLEGGDELTKCRFSRDSHWNDLVTIKRAMNISGDYSITRIMSWIDEHLKFERDVGEKDKQILKLNERITELEGKLTEKEKELKKLKTETKDVGDTAGAAKEVADAAGEKVDRAISDIGTMKDEAAKIKEDAKVVIERSWIDVLAGWLSGLFSRKRPS